MALVSRCFVIPVETHDDRPHLLVSVRKYSSPFLPQSHRSLTIVLTHAVTFHKELWEPTLSHLFLLQSRSNNTIHIHEAWAIDAPNHGESSALNDCIISQGNLITFRDYARAITAFLDSGLLDLSVQHIIGIGHSGGTAPLIWATDEWYRRTNTFPFCSLILFEPPIISVALDAKYGNFNARLAAKALRRRNDWSSKEEAIRWLRKQQKSWDPRCSALYAEYGLRRPSVSSSKVVLSCHGRQEAACYSVSEQDEVLDVLSRLCPLIPVHTIFAEFVDLSPNSEIRENIIDPSQGRRMASVTRMPKVGHFAPFENPGISASAIFHCLTLWCSGAHGPSACGRRNTNTDARL